MPRARQRWICSATSHIQVHRACLLSSLFGVKSNWTEYICIWTFITFFIVIGKSKITSSEPEICKPEFRRQNSRRNCYISTEIQFSWNRATKLPLGREWTTLAHQISTKAFKTCFSLFKDTWREFQRSHTQLYLQDLKYLNELNANL